MSPDAKPIRVPDFGEAVPLVVNDHEGRELLRITHEGRLVLGEDVTVDEAAAGFVEAVNLLLGF